MIRPHGVEGSLVGLSDFIAELKRRRVIRALLAWGIASFAVLQIYEPVMHGLHLPEWTLSFVVVALGLGFPVTAALAWVFDLKAGGIERTRPTAEKVPGSPRTAPSPWARFAILVGIGFAAASPGLAYYFVWPGVAFRQAGGSEARSAITDKPSIAVLAFTDMSPQKDQEYLSDGVAEEILNVLTRVEGLKVVGRTSSFSFKGKDVVTSEIGRRLAVGSLLEGSVRRDGNRIRIAAELVNAADGVRLWSKTYDGEMGAAFAIQDEVARDVAMALQVKLLPAKGQTRAVVPEAYTQYMIAKQIASQGSTREDWSRAMAGFERAIALDPGFAAPLARLGQFLAGTSNDVADERSRRLQREAAWDAVAQAIRLAPDEAEGYTARGFLKLNLDLDWAGAESDFEHALRLNPSNPITVGGLGIIHRAMGRQDEAIRAFRRAVELDPLSSNRWVELSDALLGSGDVAGARKAAHQALEISPGHADAGELARLADLLEGRADKVLESVGREKEDWRRLQSTAIAEHALGHLEPSTRALKEFTDRFGPSYPYEAAEAHAWCGHPDEAFAWLDRTLWSGKAVGDIAAQLGTDPLLRNLHSDPRWKALLRRLNLPVS
jgi:TolB-like protein